MKHELKIWPVYFEAVLSGDKRFEIRNNTDRGFQKGDLVKLIEYDPKTIPDYKKYTGRNLLVEIIYVTNYEQKEGMVVFGFKLCDSEEIK